MNEDMLPVRWATIIEMVVVFLGKQRQVAGLLRLTNVLWRSKRVAKLHAIRSRLESVPKAMQGYLSVV